MAVEISVVETSLIETSVVETSVVETLVAEISLVETSVVETLVVGIGESVENEIVWGSVVELDSAESGNCDVEVKVLVVETGHVDKSSVLLVDVSEVGLAVTVVVVEAVELLRVWIKTGG